jgi:hypothetical protein
MELKKPTTTALHSAGLKEQGEEANIVMGKRPQIAGGQAGMIEKELQGFLEGFRIEPVDEMTDVVTTPFSDNRGSPIKIFVRQRGSQFYLFNEKDRVFLPEKIGRWVRLEVKDNFRTILRRFDAYHINGEISTEATRENLPARLRNLIQALILLDALV